uniref:WGS project CAEQ00000000 data, annotated contig 881 n=1 Tax=Trypanosoma congolense (strain IL3000) TaxID=1068625 RepID=F9WJ76_TRYCI|nr:unnamed protein product [Trypanosoma congolense IL3000]
MYTYISAPHTLFFILRVASSMQSWYQFGYDGFPSGEARRRFYCQRDDPCDSEEELEGYDGNDRPIYYYPLPISEETSTTSEEEDTMQRQPPASPFLIRVSVNSELPCRCGSSTVPLCSGGDAGKRAYFFAHGGMLTATRRVTNTSEVLLLRTLAECPNQERLVDLVPTDVSLREAISESCWSSFGAGGAFAGVGVMPSPPSRFGHCAVVVTAPFSADMVSPRFRDDCALHLTLVIGGAVSEQIPTSLHDLRARNFVLCDPWLCMTVLRTGSAPEGYGSGRRKGLCSPYRGVETKAAHYTTHVPLAGMTGLNAAPRVFATLTPWPIANEDSTVVSYAYLGGSINGWDPLPLFGLWLLRVDTSGWTVSAVPVETFGEEPASRFGHSATLVNEQEIYVFGGIGIRRTYLNDLVVLNCSTKVWREVYTPFCFSIPPRAFHSSALFSAIPTILIVGGEADGRHEPSVWMYNVSLGVWHLLLFPLLERSLLTPCDGNDTAPTSRVISAIRLLCERERASAHGKNAFSDVLFTCKRHMYRSSGESVMAGGVLQQTASAARTGDHLCSLKHPQQEENLMFSLGAYYFSAMHGSLPQLLPANGGIMVAGGTKSPSVTSLSWISMRNYSLRECAAVWICTYHTRLLKVVRRCLQPHYEENAFCDAGAPRGTALGGSRASLVDRSLADDQLDQWQREARKRLRN